MPKSSEKIELRKQESLVLETFDFKGEITAKINQQFPLVTTQNAAFSAYMKGDIHYCSIGPATDPAVRTAVLIEALKRAGDEEAVEFSPHGAEHKTYAEVLKTMISFVQDGQATIRAGSKTVPVDKKLTMRRVETFVLEAPPFERTSYIPRPLIEASSIQTDTPTLIKLARKYALNETYGYAFALLVLTYKGVSTDLIMKSLGNPDWLQNTQSTLKGRVLREGQGDVRIIIDFLHRTLMVADPGGAVRPTNDPKQFEKAVRYLRDHSFDVKSHEYALGFDDTTVHAQPRVVLTSATEIAERLAHPQFADPVRHKWIADTYGDIMTTRVKTAYFVIE